MFCHLHVTSGYSFLSGAFTLETLIERVKALDMKAIALTDRKGLYGAVKLQRCCFGTGIKPIIGVEAPLCDKSILVLLAMNATGYSNLCQLITRAHLENNGVFPLRLIEEHSRGLICLTGGREGKVWKCTQSGATDEAYKFLLVLRDIFRDRLFLEIQNHRLRDDLNILQELFHLSRKTAVPPIATNSVTFLSREDYRVHRTLIEIQRVIHHREIEPVPSDQFYLKSEAEMREVIGIEEAIANTGAIADSIAFELPLGKIHPPRLSNEDFERLTTLCFTNLPRKYHTIQADVISKLWRELSLIEERGFASYFLVVHEIIQWAKSKGIRCSIRGSAVSSVVSHLLFGGIDPIDHNLLFERFLSESRFDPPDIDVDFDSERRDDVLRYILDRFKKRAALVATAPTFRARTALREVARTLGYSYEKIGGLTRFMPYHLCPSDIPQALENLPELKHSPLRREQELLEIASGLDGLPRQLSVHLGGVAISEDLLDTVPLQCSPRGFPVCQYDKDDIELLGLAKFDILGLRMHTAITKALRYVREQGYDIDIDDLPLNDSKTYQLLKSTDTVGVFQVESPGQRQLLGRLQPERFSDIIAEISLFRPGPMQAEMIDPFVNRKQGRKAVMYLHPSLEKILKETYGVLIYQEQVLRIVAQLTGAGLDWADVFRRSMTKDRGRRKWRPSERNLSPAAEEMGLKCL